MSIRYNEPTVEFCVEAYLPGSKEPVDRFLIQQNEGPKRDTARERKLWNAVQVHLNGLSVKTGLDYHIVRWGNPGDRRNWLRGQPFDE